MSKMRDLTGQRFGLLTVIRQSGRNADGVLWLCRCDCGNEKVVARGPLTSKVGMRSCGCAAHKDNLAGKQFGKLTVREECGKSPDGKILWCCDCACGKTSVVRGTYLKRGHTGSCGTCSENSYSTTDAGYVVGKTVNGFDFRFDREDFAAIKARYWYMYNSDGYVYTNIKRRNVPMHVFLEAPPKGICVDHVNRCKSDNRRSNLRLSDKRGNSANTGLQRNNKTGGKGVHARESGKFAARIGYDYQSITLGTFDTFEEAAQAYDEAARYYFGEFACTNEMIQDEKQLGIRKRVPFHMEVIANV
jgi:hypothetical protein